jgi:hypothetical protein
MHGGSTPIVEALAGPDVMAFITRSGLVHALERILDLTHATFPLARRIATSLEDDAEIPGQQYVMCSVEVADLDPDEAAMAWEEWHRNVGQHVPAAHSGTFCLRLELCN